jgi:hypothetical protein
VDEEKFFREQETFIGATWFRMRLADIYKEPRELVGVGHD